MKREESSDCLSGFRLQLSGHLTLPCSLLLVSQNNPPSGFKDAQWGYLQPMWPEQGQASLKQSRQGWRGLAPSPWEHAAGP